MEETQKTIKVNRLRQTGKILTILFFMVETIFITKDFQMVNYLGKP